MAFLPASLGAMPDKKTRHCQGISKVNPWETRSKGETANDLQEECTGRWFLGILVLGFRSLLEFQREQGAHSRMDLYIYIYNP